MSVSLQDAKRIARRVPEEIATERRTDLVDELFADDCVEHGPFGMNAEGRDAVKAQLGTFLDAIPDFEAVVEDIVAEDDTVAMRVTLRGTLEGDLLGVEGTGQSFEVANMAFTRIEDGMITERWLVPDTLGMLQQVGAIESPVG